MSAWRRRTIATALCAVGIDVLMASAGMGPNPFVVAGLVMIAALALSLAFDLAGEVQPADRPDTSPAARRAAGRDWSVTTMVLQLQNGDAIFEEESTRQLYDGLVSLIDDQLLAEHRVDRSLEPERSASILGPELTRFVDARQPPRGFTETRALGRIVTLIERV